MKIYPIIYKVLLLLSLLTGMNLVASAYTIPAEVKCDLSQPHLPADHINDLTNTMLRQPLINEVYDQIGRNWKDIPTLNEAKTWYTGASKDAQPEDNKGAYKYYIMKAYHARYKPFLSNFCGLQEAVLVSLPKDNEKTERFVDIKGVQYSTPYFSTKLGIVSKVNIVNNEKKTNNLAFSVEGFQKIYDEYANSRGWDPKKFAKVELINGAKRPGVSRWAAISVYLAYEKEESLDPVLYAIEAATANGALPNPTRMPGQTGSTFYFAPSLGQPICSNPRDPINDQGCETGYAFTPFSSATNVYKSTFSKVKNSDPRLKYSMGLATYRAQGFGKGLEREPYFGMGVSFYEWEPQTIHNTTALHIEALLRVLALSSIEGFDIMPPARLAPQKLLSDPLNSVLSGLLWATQPMLNSVLGILGTGFKNQLPWITKPEMPAGGSKVVAEWIRNNNINYAPQTLPRDSVNGKNVVFVAYESNMIGTSLFQFKATPPTWVEYSPHNVFFFLESHRDEWSVYLIDPRRNVKLRIDLWARKIMYSDNQKTTKEIPFYNVSYAARMHTSN